MTGRSDNMTSWECMTCLVDCYIGNLVDHCIGKIYKWCKHESKE